MSAPQGWDDIPEAVLAAAREMRTTYIAMIAAGFTTNEAAMIIAHMCAANSGGQSSTGEGS